MFEPLDIPATWSHGPLMLEATVDNEMIRYCRQFEDKTVKKQMSIKETAKLVINPVEPVNTPKPVAAHLLVELDHPVVIEPQSDCTIFITCPVELGVFISGNGNNQLVDVFSFEPQKYTLYGTPYNGFICRYWRSDVSSSLPVVSPYVRSVMELRIINNTPHWSEVSRAVFSSYHMTLFYNDEMIFSKGTMKIVDQEIAATEFENAVPGKEMTQSISLYSPSKLNLIKTAFLMEHGL